MPKAAEFNWPVTQWKRARAWLQSSHVSLVIHLVLSFSLLLQSQSTLPADLQPVCLQSH